MPDGFVKDFLPVAVTTRGFCGLAGNDGGG